MVGMKVKAESFQGIDLSTNLYEVSLLLHHKIISSLHKGSHKKITILLLTFVNSGGGGLERASSIKENVVQMP